MDKVNFRYGRLRVVGVIWAVAFCGDFRVRFFIFISVFYGGVFVFRGIRNKFV